MTIKHQITTDGQPAPKVADVLAQVSGLIGQAQGLVTAGVGLPSLQAIGAQIASVGPSIADVGGSASIASAVTTLGQQMTSANMAAMTGILSSLTSQLSQLTTQLNLGNMSQVLHSHVLDAIKGIVHSAFQGKHTVALGSDGINLTSSTKVAHSAPTLPHNGLTLVSDALQVTKGITGQSFGMLSDRKLKTKVRKHAPVLDLVMQLRLKSFLVRAMDFETGQPIAGVEPRFSVGFIAQQFRKVFPHLVTRIGNYFVIEEGKVGPILTAALQEFVTETRAEIAALQAEIAELKRR